MPRVRSAALLVLAAAAVVPAVAGEDVTGPGLGIGTRRGGIDSLTGGEPVLPASDLLPPRLAEPARAAWWPPGGYLGLSLGRADDGDCAGPCDDASTPRRLYAGGMFNPYLGVELGWLDLGRFDHGPGSARAHGLDLSLVGRLPLGHALGAWGRLGTTWGRTRVDADAGSGLVPGDASGFGLTVGAGLSYDVDPHWSALLEWEQRDLRFPGEASVPVSGASLGLRFRF